MSKTLVLAEKPSVGRDMARVLHCSKKGNGFFENNQYIVTWALGHLITLAEPEVYDEKYKSWRLEDLPMLPQQLKLVTIKKSSRQFQIIKTQMKRKDVREIVIATDAGREGELVGRWIIEKAHIKKPIKRLWISSVTDQAIKDGFAHLHSGKKFENLYAAAVARAEADWFVGMNATRALTTKFNAQLSCGRVQTPTLAMIAARDEEIKRFQPKTFYGMTAVTNHPLKLIWQDKQTKHTRIFDKDKCDHILQKIKHEQATVTKVEQVYKKSFAPGLYDLTELQREANQKFSFTAKETLSILQKLYEQHKLLTYPRTDSKYVSTDIVATLKDRMQACAVGPYAKIASAVLRKPIKAHKSFVDDRKVSDHHAIIPTEERANLNALNQREKKVYDLVVKRFLAVFYPPFEYEQTTISAKIAGEHLLAKGKRILSPGWKEIYEQQTGEQMGEEDQRLPEDVQDQTLPPIKEGDCFKIKTVAQTKGETKPPARFNEGSLLSAMENPVKYMAQKDQKLIKTMNKTGGIGTVATRADIIEKLLNTFLIEKKGKDMFITSKGRQLLDLVPEDLKSPALTAEWEQKLESIAKGSLTKDVFIQEMKDYTQSVVREIKHSTQTFKHDNRTGKKCPRCGKFLLEVNGKKGKMLVCQDRECGHRKNVSKMTNARCPKCRKKLELRGEGEGQIFVCKCGHKEKVAAFNARKKKEKSKASRKDVTQYLKQQHKQHDEPFNPALAEALAKLKDQD